MRISVVSNNNNLINLTRSLDQDIYHFSYFDNLTLAGFSLVSATDVLILDRDVDIFSLEELHRSLDGELPYLIYLGEQNDAIEISRLYQLGVDDYLLLSDAEYLLEKKLSAFQRTWKRLQQLTIDYEFAHKTAMDAMTGNSELGQIMHFVEQSNNIHDCQLLADKFFQTTSALGLNCVLLIEMSEQNHFFSSSEQVKPLEEQLLLAAKNAQRFHDFGVRTVINYPNASLLIKNMPIAEINRYGRIKDALPTLLSSLDAKLGALAAETMIRNQAVELGGAFDVVKASFMHLNAVMSEKIKSGNQTMSVVLNDLTHNLPGMGLEEDQEEYILGKVDNVMEDSSELILAEREMSQIFDSIRDNLHGLVDKQNRMLEFMIRDKRVEEEDQQVDSSGDNMVELF
ncbi:MAG: hypothetical protein OEX03_02305 [Gammaproteobacteria bacterium]|nr:hypothetical protein [Gammaproteobacteria bacterium]